MMSITRLLRSAALLVLMLSTTAAGQGLAEEQHVVFPEEVFPYNLSRPAVGTWLGNLSLPEGRSLAAALVVDPDGETGLAAKLTCLQISATDTICTDVAATGRALAFQLDTGPFCARFEGTISENGQRFAGRISLEQADQVGRFELARTLRPIDLQDMMAFSGKSKVNDGLSLPMTIALAETPGGGWVGHLDSPWESFFELPLFNITAREVEEGTAVTTTLLGFPATIEVTISRDRQRISGRYLQDPFDLSIDYEREPGYTGGKLNRPQHPKPPYPYETRELQATHPDGHVLAGTLTIPDRKRFGPGPFPVAVLISRSGYQDRDETIFGHKPFLVIADYLTRHGVAVMRYDDRGIGGSAIDDPESLMDLTSEDLAGDTLVVVAAVKAVDEIDAARVGLIGHGEGAIIGPMVAQRDESIAFMVLLAGPGVPGVELISQQSALLRRTEGLPKGRFDEFRSLVREAMQCVVEQADEALCEAAFRRVARLRIETGDPTPLETLVAAYRNLSASAWMQFFLDYDPRPALAALNCPVLALNGELDLQVDCDQNLPEIQRAIRGAGGDVATIRYERLNHLFQPSKTGDIGECLRNEITFDKRVLADMMKWLRQKLRPEDGA